MASKRSFLFSLIKRNKSLLDNHSSTISKVISLFKNTSTSLQRREAIKRLQMVCGPYPRLSCATWKQAESDNDTLSGWAISDPLSLMTKAKAATHSAGLDIISILHSVPNPRQPVYNIARRFQENQKMQLQDYQPEQVKKLGPDVAAIHFFVDRRAAVRLLGHNDWISGGQPKLTEGEIFKKYLDGWSPDEDRYVHHCHVEAVDCSHFNFKGIKFEGLKNLTDLYHLKWLSLRNQKRIDAWCLDRIAGQNGTSLEYLDISDCDLDIGCIIALAKMRNLKMLVLKNPRKNLPVRDAIIKLQEEKPYVIINPV